MLRIRAVFQSALFFMVVDVFFLVLDCLMVEFFHNTINCYVHIPIPLRSRAIAHLWYVLWFLPDGEFSPRVTPYDFVSPDQNVDRYESISAERIHARCR